MHTPYFLINKDIFDDNIDEFFNAFSNHWKNSILSYSVKTNSLPWVLKHMKERGAFAEVVSDEEYELAKLCGFNDTEIIFNGPIKSIQQLEIANGKGAIINIDSKRDIDFVLNHEINDIKKIGIRINVNHDVFEKNDIGYADDGFRFGFSYENGELGKVITKLKNKYGDKIEFGLHLHCNTITRSLNAYQAIARYAANIIRKYNLTPSFIDMGGGYFGGVENKPKANDYIRVIKRELESLVNFEQCKLIVEPGSAIIGSAVDFYTSVLDVKDTTSSRIITTDGSRINIDPLWSKKGYMYSLKTQSNNNMEKQIICGYTCMDHDRLMKLKDEKELNVGDNIIYHRVGAYSMTFGGPFIRYFPNVYVKDENKNVFLVRNRMDVEEYYHIHTNL